MQQLFEVALWVLLLRRQLNLNKEKKATKEAEKGRKPRDIERRVTKEKERQIRKPKNKAKKNDGRKITSETVKTRREIEGDRESERENEREREREREREKERSRAHV